MSHNKKVTDADIVRAVQGGHETKQTLADALDLHPGNMGRRLKNACEAGILSRERDGRSFVYEVRDGVDVDGGRVVRKATGSEKQSDDPNAQDVTFNRDYDWTEFIPLSPPDYIPTNGEREETVAKIAGRHRRDGPVTVGIGGPTGAGKTAMVAAIAAEGDGFDGTPVPVITQQCTYDMRRTDIIGSPTIQNGDSVFQDGPLAKALLCSQERPVIYLVDEYKRAKQEALEEMFSAFDHRCRVELPGIAGSVTVQGNPNNLVVIGTKNEGAGYNESGGNDMATERRFKEQHYIDYLGTNYPDKERDLVSDRTGISAAVAEKMVAAANEMRSAAKDRNNHIIKHGVPTATVIEWAHAALDNEAAGLSDPLARAMESSVINVFYKDMDRPQVETEAVSKMESHILGMTVTTADEDDDATVVCTDCDFEMPRAHAEDSAEVDLVEMLCPECGALLDEE